MRSEWFLGFVEGEGNFVVSFFTKVYKDRHYVWARPAFQLGQSGDVHVLQESQQFLIEYNIISHLHTDRNQLHHYKGLQKLPDNPLSWSILQVFEMDSLKRLINLMEPLHWFSAKRADFEKWIQCVNILSAKNKSKYMISELRQIVQILPSMNGGKCRRVWTPEHLELHLKTREPYRSFLENS